MRTARLALLTWFATGIDVAPPPEVPPTTPGETTIDAAGRPMHDMMIKAFAENEILGPHKPQSFAIHLTRASAKLVELKLHDE